MYGVDMFYFWSKLSIFSSGGDISCVLSVYVANSRSHPLQKLPCCLACQVRKIHPLIQFIPALFFPRRGLLKTQSTENVPFVTSQRAQILPPSASYHYIHNHSSGHVYQTKYFGGGSKQEAKIC